MGDGNSSDPRTWATRSDAAKRLGVSLGKLRKLEMQGLLAGELDSKGQYRFSDEAIEEARAAESIADEEVTQANVITALAQGLRQTHVHNEKLFELVTESLKVSLSNTAAQLTEARAEIEKLRVRDAEMVAQREDLETKRHERELEALRALRHQERLDQLGRELAPHLVVLARQFVGRFSGGGMPLEPPPASPPAPSPGDPSPPAPAPGGAPPSPPLDPLGMLARVPSLEPAALHAVCDALTPEQVQVVMASLVPRLDAVQAELERKALGGTPPANDSEEPPPS